MNARPRHRSSPPSLLTRLNRFVRALLFLAALLAVAATAVYFYARSRADEEIRAFCESKFNQHYAEKGLVVSLGHARLAEGRGIELRDLAVLDPSADAPHAELVRIDQIFVSADVELADLLSGPPAAKHIAVHRLQLRAARQVDGRWNIARLFPLPKFGDDVPEVAVDDALVEIQDSRSGEVTQLDLREINLSLQATGEFPQGLPAPSESAAPYWRIEGSLAGDHFQQIEVSGTIEPESGVWSLAGKLKDLRLSRELYAKLPQEFAESVKPLAGLQARATLDFEVSRFPGRARPIEFMIQGGISQGHFRDSRLPYPLTDIAAEFYADPDELRITKMIARSGSADVQLSGRQLGFVEGSPLQLDLDAQNLQLDQRLASKLPLEWRKSWSSFAPAGPVDLRLSLQFDGRRWQRDILVECRGCSFAYQKFPYRIRQCSGVVHLVDDVARVDVHGMAGGRDVHFDGTFRHPGPNFTGGVEVTLDGAIPVDEQLLSSIPGDGQRVARSLDLRGMITFTGRFERSEPHQQGLSIEFDVGVHSGAIRYERFPYPIENIRGLLRYRDGTWEFRNLEGSNDSGYIVCDGSWRRGQTGGVLKLNFVGNDIPIEDELRRALGGGVQRIWTELRPHGNVDQVNVDLLYESASKRLKLDVTAQKWKKTQEVEGRTISIEPNWFPYRLDNLTGTLRYRDGKVELTNVTGRHNKTVVALDGHCSFTPAGAWYVNLKNLSAERLVCDHDLTSALPGKLGDGVRRLNVTGPLNMYGGLQIWGSRAPTAKPSAKWNLTFDLENGGIAPGFNLEHIHGGISLQGEIGPGGFHSYGALEIDSLIYNDVQLTEVRGPVWIDESRLLFGQWTSQAAGGHPRPIEAKVFGGLLSGNADVAAVGDNNFFLKFSLSDAQLERVAQEVASHSEDISGRAFAAAELRGNAKGTHTWRGGGIVRLRNADLYRLPVMLALLQVLSMQPPDDSAFDTGDVDFHIQGDHIYFDRFDFTGNAVTLKGNGWMNLDRQINIDFYTMVGRDRFRIPIITPALGAVSRELLLVHAGGTLDDPKLGRKSIPGLNDRLKKLFPEAESEDNAASRPGFMRR